jgi:hypothetical protein
MEPILCPETSVNNYNTTPRNVPEERSYQHRGGSLKSKLCQSFEGALTRNWNRKIFTVLLFCGFA